MEDLRIFVLIWFGMVRSGLVCVWSGMVHGYCLHEIPCQISSSWIKKPLSCGQLKDIWYGMVRYGLVLNGMVHGYYLDVHPCKISSS